MQSWIIRGAVCLALAAAFLARAHGPGEDMAEAARNFLAALPEAARQKAVFELKDEERQNWRFTPRPRKGLPIKEMSGDQRALALALLNSGLSHRGYFKAMTIMSLEQILQEIEQGRGPVRDSELYFVSIFGRPESHGHWGWRVEGHHLALNFTIAGDAVAVTPSMFGSNPGEVREGPRQGLRTLGREEDLGRALVRSLTEAQRKVAIYTNTAPADIITGEERRARVLEPKGVVMSDLNASQKEMLWDLIEEYVGRAHPGVAEVERARLEAAGESKIYFAWAGSLEPRQGHYYRIQAPDFLLEYDNTQNNANHVHAVWRDLKNDFGEDLLRKHYEESHAK